MQNTQHYDLLGTRYTLVAENSTADFNWLCLPGGPGADAKYFNTLLEHLTLPGKTWLVDFPENGDNIKNANYDFDQWDQCLLAMVNQFDNPIIIGHSFGGMYPLLFPELENILNGFVILNGTPCSPYEEAEKLAKKHNVAPLSDDMQRFSENPNQETFDKALLTCLPYYFPPQSFDKGRKLLENLCVNYHAAVWGVRKLNSNDFSARWIPQKVPTLSLVQHMI